MDPYGSAFAASFGGIKHFQDFKQADYNGVFESAKSFPKRLLNKNEVKTDFLEAALAAPLGG